MGTIVAWGTRMKKKSPLRRAARPLLLAVAGTASLAIGCGDDATHHPSGNLLAAQMDGGHDQAVEIEDIAPSGNLLAAPDLAEQD